MQLHCCLERTCSDKFASLSIDSRVRSSFERYHVRPTEEVYVNCIKYRSVYSCKCLPGFSFFTEITYLRWSIQAKTILWILLAQRLDCCNALDSVGG